MNDFSNVTQGWTRYFADRVQALLEFIPHCEIDRLRKSFVRRLGIYPNISASRHKESAGFSLEAHHSSSRRSTRGGCDMKFRYLGFFLLMATLGFAQANNSDGDAAFQKLSALVGDWEGKYEWTGGRPGGELKASYYLTGNSSALVENLIMGGVPSMTTVYHLDNGDLRATHFCAAKNQPRLKASKIDLSNGTITFALVDVTNVSSLAAPFVHGLDVQLAGGDRLELTFHFENAGKKSDEHITLKRVAKTSSRRRLKPTLNPMVRLPRHCAPG